MRLGGPHRQSILQALLEPLALAASFQPGPGPHLRRHLLLTPHHLHGEGLIATSLAKSCLAVLGQGQQLPVKGTPAFSDIRAVLAAWATDSLLECSFLTVLVIVVSNCTCVVRCSVLANC